MTQHTKLCTVRTDIETAIITVKTDQMINSTHLEDYNTMITKAVVVHLSYQYYNRLSFTGMIHCLT